MNNKKEYFCYGTDEYQEKEKSFKLNTEEASLVFSEFYFKNNTDKRNVKINLDVIYDEYYIFSDKLILYNTKTGEYFVKNTYWVNGNTKEIMKSPEEILEVTLRIPKHFFSKSYSK